MWAQTMIRLGLLNPALRVTARGQSWRFERLPSVAELVEHLFGAQ
jgi:hypothetical protein